MQNHKRHTNIGTPQRTTVVSTLTSLSLSVCTATSAISNDLLMSTCWPLALVHMTPLQATEAAAAAASAEQQQQQQGPGAQQQQQQQGAGPDPSQQPAGSVLNLDRHLAAKAGRPTGTGHRAAGAEEDWGEEPLGDDLLPM
jgi:hypothetical protein